MKKATAAAAAKAERDQKQQQQQQQPPSPPPPPPSADERRRRRRRRRSSSARRRTAPAPPSPKETSPDLGRLTPKPSTWAPPSPPTPASPPTPPQGTGCIAKTEWRPMKGSEDCTSRPVRRRDEMPGFEPHQGAPEPKDLKEIEKKYH